MNRAHERATRREIERRLAETPAGEPPAELASRLLAEVPDRLEAAPRTAGGGAGPWRAPRWLAAAAVAVVAVGGAWMLWRLGGEAVPAAREAWRAGEGAAAAGGETPRRAPSAAPLRDAAEDPAEPPGQGVGGGPRSARPEEASSGAVEVGEHRLEGHRRRAAEPAEEESAGPGLAASEPMHVEAAAEPPAYGESRAERAPAAAPPRSSSGESFEQPAPAGGAPAGAMAAGVIGRGAGEGAAAGAPPRAPAPRAGGRPAREPSPQPAAPSGRGAGDLAEAAPAPPPAAAPRRQAGASADAEPAAPRRSSAAESGEGAEAVAPPLLSLPPVGFDHARAARQGRLVLPEPPAPSASLPAPGRPPAPRYARLSITLRVTTFAADVPWQGAEVELELPDGSARRAVTDAQGVATFTDLEPGTYGLAARGPSGAVVRADPVVLTAERSGTVSVTMQLLPDAGSPRPVAVRVVDEPSRQPLPGAVVAFESGDRRIARAVGPDGSVALRLPPGTYRVEASLEGFIPESATIEVTAEATPPPFEIALPLAYAAELVVVTGEPLMVVGEAPKIISQATTGAVVGGRRTGAGAISPREMRSIAPAPAAAEPPPDGLLLREMRFRHWGVHRFVDTARDRLSTFGLEVDTGSWGLVASYLERGLLPPPEAVRVEEVVNALDYGDPAPRGGETFRVTVEGAPTPFTPGPDHRLLRFGLRARSIDPAGRRPATLVFVVDVSGSMEAGGRLELVKEALGLLLDQLGDGDRVAVVAFSDDARVVLPPTADRGAARRALAALTPDGSTNAEAGLALGYRLAWEARRPGAVHRVLLLSDGVANVGATVAESILARAAGAAADGIELSTFGVGMGNYDDVLLEQLADRGDGRYAYVDDVETARRLFVGELAGTLETVAEEARVQVAFDPRAVLRWRLLGYENRDIEDRRFRHDHAVDAGEIGAGHTVTALYEVQLARDVAPGTPIAHLTLRYREPDGGRFREVERMVVAGELAVSWQGAPRGLRLAAVAAELAERLRGAEYAAEGDLAAVAREVGRGVGDGDERVRELVEMVERVEELRAE